MKGATPIKFGNFDRLWPLTSVQFSQDNSVTTFIYLIILHNDQPLHCLFDEKYYFLLTISISELSYVTWVKELNQVIPELEDILASKFLGEKKLPQPYNFFNQ